MTSAQRGDGGVKVMMESEEENGEIESRTSFAAKEWTQTQFG